MMNSDNYFERLRQMDIVQVAERCGAQVRRRGSSLVTLCPWHEDHHPSLVLYPQTHSCHCFACGNGGTPIDFVMAHRNLDLKQACEWLEPRQSSCPSSYHAPRQAVCAKKSITAAEVPRPERDEGKIVTFDYTIPLSYVSTENSFSQCMAHLFDTQTVERVTHQYLLGRYDERGNPDDVLFPSIDCNGEVRDMKIQHYCTDPTSPRFFHCDRDHILWWGGLPSVREHIPPGMRLDRDCLFGEHLLTRHPALPVALVESPKNACLGSAIQPDVVWVATGNKDQLKPQVLEVLRGRQVIVVPDRDAAPEWTEKLARLSHITDFTISDFQSRFHAQGDSKFDIGDAIIEESKNQ